MKALKDFIIPFVGLKEGEHEYAFDLDGRFFESFEYSEIEKGKVHVDMRLEKQHRMMIFYFNIKGFVKLPCDRCLDEMDFPVDGEERLIVKFGEEWKEETDEILIIPEKESSIDVSGFIYEYIMLTLPFQRVHEDESLCNRDVADKLARHTATETDPRWEALKELKDKID